MKLHSIFFLLTVLVSSFRLEAAQIVCQGEFGNSGEQGATLVRFGTTPASGMGIVYDEPTGSLWSRGGDGVLNRYALDGRLLATYPIAKVTPPSNQDRLIRVGDKIIMTLGGKLYALPIDAPSGTAATPLNVAANIMSASSVNGSIAIGAVATLNRNTWQLSLYNVDTGQTTPLLANPLSNVRQIELLPNGDLVVHIPGTTLGDAHVNGVHELHLFHNGQEVTDGWPRPTPGANIQFLEGYWYGAAYNSTIRRFNASLEPDPGVILGGGSGAFIGHVENNAEVGQPCGLVKIRDGLYAVAGSTGIVHLLEWDPAKIQFSIIRRLGAIPVCHGLALNRQGDVWYDSGMWHWNDPPDLPQREGSVSLDMGQAVMLPTDHFIAPILRSATPWVMAGDFTSFVVSDYDAQDMPTQPAGPFHPSAGFLSGSVIYRDQKGALLLLIIDSTGKSRTYRPSLSPGHNLESCGDVALETASPVKEWTALAMKDPDTLLGAGDGYVIEMARDGANWKETRRWNTVPDGAFGSRIYLAADAGRLWISDTDNHRVLCLNLADGTLLASFGEKGKAGDDLAHLDAPRVLQARDNRAIVFDSGNQRLVKLLFSE